MPRREAYCMRDANKGARVTSKAQARFVGNGCISQASGESGRYDRKRIPIGRVGRGAAVKLRLPGFGDTT